MKHAKIVGLLVAFGGVVASFAAASALYVSGPNQIGFGIGATYVASDGRIDYLIDGKSSGVIAPKYLNDDGGVVANAEGLGGAATQVLFEFPVSATFQSHAQPYVVGNFAVSMTNINAALVDHASVWIQVKGWSSEYSGKWGESADNSNFMASGDELITSTSFSKNKDIAVSSVEEQNVSVYVKLENGVSGAALLALAEGKLFDISVTWGQVSAGYKYAFVVGNKTQWEEDEVYAMQPNLKANSFGWYYAGLTDFSAAKVKKESTWAPNDDQELNPAHHYNVSWNGGAEGEEGYYCSFDDLDATPQP